MLLEICISFFCSCKCITDHFRWCVVFYVVWVLNFREIKRNLICHVDVPVKERTMKVAKN
jgi:hypothetical protein